MHADENRWRETGKNGYVWTYSTPTARYFTWGTRHGAEVDRALGDAFRGVLVADFYAAYDHYPGPAPALLGPPTAGHPRPLPAT